MDEPSPSADARRPRLTGVPWTLWTYVIWELLRVFAVTTGVIVTVIAFGAAALAGLALEAARGGG